MHEGSVFEGYRIEKLIGTGQYGSVYRVNKDGKTYAMKKMDKLKQPTQTQVARDELSRLLCFVHPFIILYFDYFRYANGPEIFMIMEFCTGTNMKTAINNTREQNGRFTVANIKNWLVQLLMAVAYLHQSGIVHREVKPNNIFIMEDNEHVKLGDLSLVRELNAAASVAISSARRKRESYRAPELWQGLDISYKVDEWSLGCVLYELMRLEPAFETINTENIIHARYEPITEVQYHNTELIEVMQSLLEPNPDRRPHAAEILKGGALNATKVAVEKMYKDMLEKMPVPVVPEEVDVEFPLERDDQGQYPPQPWATSDEHSMYRHIWRDMVAGYGGMLPFVPYSLSLPPEYGSDTVMLFLARRDAESGGSLGAKKDMRILVQTQKQHTKRLRLRFYIKMQFPKLGTDQPLNIEEEPAVVANTNLSILYSVQKFDWSALDGEKPPLATVAITPEWI